MRVLDRAGPAAHRRRHAAALGAGAARDRRRGRGGRGRPARRRWRLAGRRRQRDRVPPRRADDRRQRPGRAPGHLRGQRARDLERSRGLPRAGGRHGRVRLLGQGLRGQRRASLPGGLPAAGRAHLRRQQGGGRRVGAQLLAQPRGPGRGDALRQPLRRRRPQLHPPDSRGGERRARRARPGDPLRRLARSATSSTSRTLSPPTWRSPKRSTQAGAAARRSTPGETLRIRWPRSWG